MATARPFAYNTGSTIPGTEQLGDLSIGTPTSGFTNNPQYWNGPDEDLGYVIAQPVPTGNQPNPVGGSAYVGFFRSDALTDNSFLELAEVVAGQTFASASIAFDWLSNNGYWTNFIPPAVTPTPTVTPSSTQTPTPTPSITSSPTQTPTPSITSSPTQTPTPSITSSPTPSVTPTLTRTPTQTPTVSPTLTRTPTPSPTPGLLKVLFLGDSSVNTVATNINSYITSTGQSITYSAASIGTTYTGSGNITKANYDVVMIYTNSGAVGTTTLANALTTFVGQGGSVVSGVFLWNLYPSGYNFTGTTAFNFTNSQGTSVGNFTVVSATTITNGIGTALPAAFSNNNPTLVSGAIQLATFTNGDNCLALKTVGSSKNISINAFPGSGIVNSTSTMTKMFGNAILYAGGKI